MLHSACIPKIAECESSVLPLSKAVGKAAVATTNKSRSINDSPDEFMLGCLREKQRFELVSFPWCGMTLVDNALEYQRSDRDETEIKSALFRGIYSIYSRDYEANPRAFREGIMECDGMRCVIGRWPKFQLSADVCAW